MDVSFFGNPDRFAKEKTNKKGAKIAPLNLIPTQSLPVVSTKCHTPRD
jgi:hypothetical protein